MTNTQLDLTADIIDTRDIIERVEELESELEDFLLSTDNTCIGDWEEKNPEEGQELRILQAILEDLKGNGGDEQWCGDWYPVTLIRESYFTDYTREMLEDCGTIPRDLPHWIHIDWELTAREVKVDYSEVTIDGATYFYR